MINKYCTCRSPPTKKRKGKQAKGATTTAASAGQGDAEPSNAEL